MIFCFDLDNTLCTSVRRDHPEDILRVKPLSDNIKIVRELKKKGHKITIFTRRGELKRGRQLTKKWLKEYKVPYDKLITKKPKYDLIIDDRAISIYKSNLTAGKIERQAIGAMKKVDKNLCRFIKEK